MVLVAGIQFGTQSRIIEQPSERAAPRMEVSRLDFDETVESQLATVDLGQELHRNGPLVTARHGKTLAAVVIHLAASLEVDNADAHGAT